MLCNLPIAYRVVDMALPFLTTTMTTAVGCICMVNCSSAERNIAHFTQVVLTFLTTEQPAKAVVLQLSITIIPIKRARCLAEIRKTPPSDVNVCVAIRLIILTITGYINGEEPTVGVEHAMVLSDEMLKKSCVITTMDGLEVGF